MRLALNSAKNRTDPFTTHARPAANRPFVIGLKCLHDVRMVCAPQKPSGPQVVRRCRGELECGVAGISFHDPGKSHREHGLFRGATDVLQEVVSLTLSIPFSVLYLQQPMKLDFVWSSMCIVGAVYLMFL